MTIVPCLNWSLSGTPHDSNSQGLYFPIPSLQLIQQYHLMKSFLDYSVVQEASTATMQHCETLLEYGTMSINTNGRMQDDTMTRLMHSSLIAAMFDDIVHWKPHHVVLSPAIAEHPCGRKVFMSLTPSYELYTARSMSREVFVMRMMPVQY